jgi:hypothetical protein
MGNDDMVESFENWKGVMDRLPIGVNTVYF